VLAFNAIVESRPAACICFFSSATSSLSCDISSAKG
jgi:hypothetical protein